MNNNKYLQKIINTKNNLLAYYNTNVNDISNNPNLLNPFKIPINNNKIYNKDYNILIPYKFGIPKSTLIFYLIYFFILFFSILKYVNLN